MPLTSSHLHRSHPHHRTREFLLIGLLVLAVFAVVLSFGTGLPEAEAPGAPSSAATR